MTSDFEGFSIPDFIHYIYFPILFLEKGHISIGDFILYKTKAQLWFLHKHYPYVSHC